MYMYIVLFDSVGIGSSLNNNELRDISSAPQQRGLTWFVASSFTSLAELDQTVELRIKTRLTCAS